MRGLIIENSFTSIDDIPDHLFFFASKFKWLILRNHWRSIDLVPYLYIPLLYVTGDRDELVPHSMTLHMHDAS